MTENKQEEISKELEKGIELLMEQMPDYVQELVSELAKQAYLPKWQLIGGIIFEGYNNGYLSAYTLDPAWKDGFKIERTICKFCKDPKGFLPVRIGQLYCCNDCGQGIAKIIEKPESELIELTESKEDKELDDLISEPTESKEKKKKKEKKNASTSARKSKPDTSNLSKLTESDDIVRTRSSLKASKRVQKEPSEKAGWSEPDLS